MGTSSFIDDLVKDIVTLFPLEFFERYRDNFLKNSRIIDPKCLNCDFAKKIKDVILEQTKGNEIKKKVFVEYLKKYLYEDEFDYLNKYPNDIDAGIIFLVSRFMHTNDSRDISEGKMYHLLNERIERQKNFCIKRILDLYIKAIEFFEREDMEDAFVLAHKINQTLFRFAVIVENLKTNVNKESDADNIELLYSRGLVPKDVIVAEVKLRSISKAYDNEELKDNYVQHFIEMSFRSLQIIMQWFVKEYASIDYNTSIKEYLNNNKDPVEYLKDWSIMDAYDVMKVHFDIKEIIDKGLQPYVWGVLTNQEYVINGEFQKNEEPKNIKTTQWYFIPLFERDFQKIKSGEISSSDIDINMIPILIPGRYNMYFSGIYLESSYRLGLSEFLKSIANTMMKLAEKGVFIQQICTVEPRENIKVILEKMGMKSCKIKEDTNSVYCGEIKDILNKPYCRKFMGLKNKYKENGLL